MKPHSDSAATNDFKCPQPSGESVAARDKPDRRRSGIPQEGQTDALPAGVQAGPTPSHSTGVGHQSSAAQNRWPDGSADECPKCGFLHAYDRSCEDRASSAAQGRYRQTASRMFSTWFVYWEGALIAYFFGLWWTLAWCAAWFVLATGIRIGRSAK